MSAVEGPDWGERIRAARAAKDHATSVYEQTVRDASAAGRSASQIARDIGRKDRTVITRILSAEPGEPVTVPSLPVVVHLTARGALWDRLATAMHQRGWMAVGNEQQAWYLSRAGATCVRVDAWAALSDDPVTVALVQAVEAQPAEEESYPVKELLPTAASIMLEREHPEAAEFRVPVQTVERRWKRLAGGQQPRPTCYDRTARNQLGDLGAVCTDVQQIARWVADLLE